MERVGPGAVLSSPAPLRPHSIRFDAPSATAVAGEPYGGFVAQVVAAPAAKQPSELLQQPQQGYGATFLVRGHGASGGSRGP
jgi:hypothetical protein